jgi:hypothetical protein
MSRFLIFKFGNKLINRFMETSPDLKSFPKIVYKYRSWTNRFHKRILTKNQVFLSPPLQFNDPFDCRIFTNYGLLDSVEKKQQFARELIAMNMNHIQQRGDDPEELFFNELRALLDIDSYQAFSDETQMTLRNPRTGVLSMSGIWNHILMWSHYADFHKGICVGFHEEKIRTSGLFGMGGPVLYTKHYPEIYPGYKHLLDEKKALEQYALQTHFKAREWSYEKEYRLLTTFRHEATIEDRTILLPDDFYAEIILGADFPENDIERVVRIAKKKKIPLYRARKIPFKFKLSRVKIS